MHQNYDEYHIIGESPDKIKKARYWQAAIGLQKVDGLIPSEYLVHLAQENVNGNLSYEEIEHLLYRHYENETQEEKQERFKECDLVSARITAILDGGSFMLNPESLKTIHGLLFKDLYQHAGMYRQVNISKKEPVLNGRSVVYADWRGIQNTLEYDFRTEKQQSYKGIDKRGIVKRIASFTSSLWQVHPFMDDRVIIGTSQRKPVKSRVCSA